MSSNSSRLYTQLLNSGVATPTSIQRMVEMFKTDPGSLNGVTLLKSGKLSAEQAEIICQAGGADELVAWINMPDRTSEEILKKVKSEKRVAILSQLTSRTDLPAEIFQSLTASSKNPQVLADIVSNESVSDEQRETAARKAFTSVVKSRQTDSVRQGKADSILGACSEELRSKLVTEFASSTLVLHRIAKRGSFTVSEEAKDALVTAYWTLVEDFPRLVANRAEELKAAAEASDRAYDPNFLNTAIEDMLGGEGYFFELFDVVSYYGAGSRLCSARREALEASLAVIEQHGRSSWGWNPAGRSKSAIESFLVTKNLEDEKPIADIQSVQELADRVQKALDASQNNAVVDWCELLTSEYANLDIVDMVRYLNGPTEREVVAELLSQKRYKFLAELVVYRLVRDADDVIRAAVVEDRQEIFDLILHELENPIRDISHQATRVRRDLFLSGLAPLEFVLEFTVEELTRLGESYLAKVWPLVEEMLGDNPETWAVFETLVNDGDIPIGLAAQSAAVI